MITREQYEKALSRMKELKSVIESRDLNTGEQQEFDTLEREIDEFTKQGKGDRERKVKEGEERADPVSLGRAILEMSRGRLSDATRAMNDIGESMRGTLGYAGTPNSLFLPISERAVISVGDNGSDTVATDMWNMYGPLKERLAAVEAGATFLTGLQGNIQLPSYSGGSAKWAGEKDASEDGAGGTSSKQMSPKRMTTYVDLTLQFLQQDSVNGQGVIVGDLMSKISEKLNQTIFGTGAGSETQPGGLFKGAISDAGEATWKRIVGLEGKLAAANASGSRMSYVTHPSLASVLKSTPKEVGTPIYLADNSQMNGYPMITSTGIASGLQAGKDEYGIVFGSWEELFIGQWGALQLTYDPYTQIGDGMIRITINAFFDALVRRTECFAIASMK